MAERSLAAKSSSPREVKRWKSDAVSTGAGAVDSMAARIVQRPSPESETRPEKRSSVGCSNRDIAVRSSGQEAVFDAVVHHFYEMAGAGRAAVEIAFFGSSSSFFAAGCAFDIATAWSKRFEDGIEVLDDGLFAA